MFKLLIFVYLLLFVEHNDGKSFKRGPLNYNSLESDDSPWPNMWFPHPPNYQNDSVRSQPVNVAAAATATAKEEEEATTDDQRNSSSEWSGLWFPQPPNYKNTGKFANKILKVDKNIHKEFECDNGKVRNNLLHINIFL